VALLLTGDAVKAEEVVQRAIDFLDAEEIYTDALLILVSTLALQADDIGDFIPAGMPEELRSLLGLTRMKRQCFVLRVLLGFSEERCARLLHVGAERIADEVGGAVCELARVDLVPVGVPANVSSMLQMMAVQL
jgi:hypothetical protein